ncbi:MAG: DUF2807 domain-containing protein [Muribaculaceae bacterium]|nr:DUF2807 domain-containing protein [Muribaculaceae bacterium]
MQKICYASLLASLMLILLTIPSTAKAQEMEDYNFTVEQFSILKIQDNVNVVYHCSQDSVAHVSYHSDPDFENAFIFTNSGETLKIQVTTEDVGKPGLPTIHVYSHFLSKVENYSDFNVQVIDPAPAPQFSASLIGNGSISVSGINSTKVTARITAGMGTIILSGKCTDAEYRMMGTGNIDADTLQADNVVCKILGGGSISCAPIQYLKVHGIGSTRVFYTGSPTIKHSGGGKLIKAD